MIARVLPYIGSWSAFARTLTTRHKPKAKCVSHMPVDEAAICVHCEEGLIVKNDACEECWHSVWSAP